VLHESPTYLHREPPVRALLKKARLVNPKNDVLWAEAVMVEERSGAPTQGKALRARALQERPTSGILWSMATWSEARPQRKVRSVDALRECEAETHS
jgi:pre-mRNA-processing factor 6